MEQRDYSSKILEITDKKGLDVILDPVLGQNFEYNVKCLGNDCRWVMYGSLGGVKV